MTYRIALPDKNFKVMKIIVLKNRIVIKIYEKQRISSEIIIYEKNPMNLKNIGSEMNNSLDSVTEDWTQAS